jgi:hypothetical protein
MTVREAALGMHMCLLITTVCGCIGTRYYDYQLCVRNLTGELVHDVTLEYGQSTYHFGVVAEGGDIGAAQQPVFDPIPAAAEVYWRDSAGSEYRSRVGFAHVKGVDSVRITLDQKGAIGDFGIRRGMPPTMEWAVGSISDCQDCRGYRVGVGSNDSSKAVGSIYSSAASNDE